MASKSCHSSERDHVPELDGLVSLVSRSGKDRGGRLSSTLGSNLDARDGPFVCLDTTDLFHLAQVPDLKSL